MKINKKSFVSASLAVGIAGGMLFVSTPAQAAACPGTYYATSGVICLTNMTYLYGSSFNAGSGGKESLPGFNDAATSVGVSKGLTGNFYRDSSYRGPQFFVAGGQTLGDLARYNMQPNRNWDKEVSSVW